MTLPTANPHINKKFLSTMRRWRQFAVDQVPIQSVRTPIGMTTGTALPALMTYLGIVKKSFIQPCSTCVVASLKRAKLCATTHHLPVGHTAIPRTANLARHSRNRNAWINPLFPSFPSVPDS
jgi:hypothetical protein